MRVICKYFERKDLKRDGIKNSCGVCKHYLEEGLKQCENHDLIVKEIKKNELKRDE